MPQYVCNEIVVANLYCATTLEIHESPCDIDHNHNRTQWCLNKRLWERGRDHCKEFVLVIV